jgi:hypothetical protein
MIEQCCWSAVAVSTSSTRIGPLLPLIITHGGTAGYSEVYAGDGNILSGGCGSAFAAPKKGPFGENAMRFMCVIGFLIVFCAYANAAARGHQARLRNGIAAPSQPETSTYPSPRGARIYRDDSVLGGWRTYHDDPPAYNDPSKFGGG